MQIRLRSTRDLQVNIQVTFDRKEYVDLSVRYLMENVRTDLKRRTIPLIHLLNCKYTATQSVE